MIAQRKCLLQRRTHAEFVVAAHKCAQAATAGGGVRHAAAKGPSRRTGPHVDVVLIRRHSDDLHVIHAPRLVGCGRAEVSVKSDRGRCCGVWYGLVNVPELFIKNTLVTAATDSGAVGIYTYL